MNEEQLKKIQEKIRFYQSHPLGAEQWIEDHVCAAITDVNTGMLRWCPIGELPDDKHPVTGRSYKQMWDWQKENIIRPATERDEDGFLKYHTVVTCTPRGEGKSYLTVLLILWRFFTQPRQLIILGANSKDQSRFALAQIIEELIINSPKLLAILGRENIREKEIRLRDSDGNIKSTIRAVSAFTGIYSNITSFAFSEIFDMTNPKFYYQLDSSRRNIPNAQGYIDSTVSEKGHVLHKLYESSPLVTGADPGILFVYRFSEEARQEDYLHPFNTQKQLDSFRTKFTAQEFAKYFKNTWDIIDTTVFSPAMIEAMKYIGHQGDLGRHDNVMQVCRSITKLRKQLKSDKSLFPEDHRAILDQIKSLKSDLTPVPYKLADGFHPMHATSSDLSLLSDIYDTNWAVGVGLDLADPLKDDLTEGARSILTCIAKGLPGSRSNPDMHLTPDGEEKKVRYIYFLLHLAHIETNEIADVQFVLDDLLYEFGTLQTLCCERWGAAELRAFCEENQISLELISPTYEKQRTGFNMLYNVVRTGYFKAPLVVVPGSEEGNILDEEMSAFRHDAFKKWYGSYTKANPKGIQDDVMFSLNWGLFGMRHLTPDDFGSGNGEVFMGTVVSGDGLVGNYKK